MVLKLLEDSITYLTSQCLLVQNFELTLREISRILLMSKNLFIICSCIPLNIEPCKIGT